MAKKECPDGKILNPKTNQCVKIDGKVGKSIISNNKTTDLSFDHVIMVIESKDYVYTIYIARHDIPLAILSAILNMQKGVLLYEDMEKQMKKWVSSRDNKINKTSIPKNSILMMKYSKHNKTSLYKTAFSNLNINNGRTMTLFIST